MKLNALIIIVQGEGYGHNMLDQQYIDKFNVLRNKMEFIIVLVRGADAASSYNCSTVCYRSSKLGIKNTFTVFLAC